jgi:hypothetical protein
VVRNYPEIQRYMSQAARTLNTEPVLVEVRHVRASSANVAWTDRLAMLIESGEWGAAWLDEMQRLEYLDAMWMMPTSEKLKINVDPQWLLQHSFSGKKLGDFLSALLAGQDPFTPQEHQTNSGLPRFISFYKQEASKGQAQKLSNGMMKVVELHYDDPFWLIEPTSFEHRILNPLCEKCEAAPSSFFCNLGCDSVVIFESERCFYTLLTTGTD